MKKCELMKQYEEVKDKVDCIVLFIHMPTGETETITNPKVAEKIAYIDKAYNDDLVHVNCKDIYIEDVIFCLKDDTYDFGAAIGFLKDGMKVARKSWNGKGMFLLYVLSEKWGIVDKIGLDIPKENLLPWIGMKTADDKFIPWLASQADMLATDWVIVE